MKRYEVLTTVKFKRSGNQTTYYESYLLRAGADITSAVVAYHKANGNHNVVAVEVLSIKNTSYATHGCKVIK